MEYIQREDSDDEYDEVSGRERWAGLTQPWGGGGVCVCLQFGRRKKKFRGKKDSKNGAEEPRKTTIEYNVSESLILGAGLSNNLLTGWGG